MVLAHSSIVTSRSLIGLDLGGTKILGVLMDEQATVQLRVRRPTPPGGETPICDAVLSTLAELIEAGRAAGHAPAAIAVGAPGYVQPETGVLLDATNLGVRNLPLGEIVAKAFYL